MRGIAVIGCIALFIGVMHVVVPPEGSGWHSMQISFSETDNDASYSSSYERDSKEPLSREDSLGLSTEAIRKRYNLDSEEVQRAFAAAKKEVGALATESAEFSLFKPQMANKTGIIYIKLHKVGGTAVAGALKRAAQESHLNVLSYKADCFKRPNEKFDMWFHHKERSDWMEECIPDGVLISLLREPVSRYISRKTWMLNRDYFIHYPSRQCSYSGPHPDSPPRRMPFQCSDDEFRKGILQNKLVQRARCDGKKTPECGEPCEWLKDGRSTDPSITYDFVRKGYGLVGTTKQLDAFLLLLALRFDFSIESLFYERCKDEFDAQPKLADLHDKPEVVELIRRFTRPEKELYDLIEADFEAYLGRLGQGFQNLLKIFKGALREYHENLNMARGATYKRWVSSGHLFYC